MEARGIVPKEIVPASGRLGEETAAALAASASRIVVSKGKKSIELPGGADAETVAAMLGPTGNLRAPTVRTGKTDLVGYEESAW